MTVPLQTTIVAYVANGATTNFAYPFLITDDADLAFLIDGVRQTTGYTVTDVGDVDGGDVVVTPAPANGKKILIYLDQRLTRETDYQQFGDWQANTVNLDFDRIWLALRSINGRTDFAIRAPIAEGIIPNELPGVETRKNKFAYFDNAGNMIQSFGTGTDEGLRSDLAAPSGPAILGFDANLNYPADTVGFKLKEQDSIWDDLSQAKINDIVAGTFSLDLTADINAAITKVYNAGRSTLLVPNYLHRVDGMIQMKSGVTLFSPAAASEYYFGSPYGTVRTAGLYKPAASGALGTMVAMETSSAIVGLYLLNQKAGVGAGAGSGITDIVRFGGNSVEDVCYNAAVMNCRLYGEATQDISAAFTPGTNTLVAAANTVFGIRYPNANTATNKQRYFNKVTDTWITNCDVGVRLSENCNGNIHSGNHIRQTYVNYDLDGGADGCVENIFVGTQHANIGILPGPASIVFRLRNNCVGNNFSAYTTENNGKAFDIDLTCAFNTFDGSENETTPSFVPTRKADGTTTGNMHASLFARTIKNDMLDVMQLPCITTGDRFSFGLGEKVRALGNVGQSPWTGTLPQLNGAGALVAASADCKKIVAFNSTAYSKSARPALFGRLRIAVNAPGGGVGESLADVEFAYRVTDNATNAASFSVIRVTLLPAAVNYIAGLYFLTGVASGAGFGIAITGGNVGAFTATHVVVELEIFAFSFSQNAVPMANFHDLRFNSVACTASDVTDAISLLTVANTAV